MIFSRSPAVNEKAWVAAGRPSTSSLSEFQTDRLLVSKTSKKSREGFSGDENDLSSVQEPGFSLYGLAGLWLPYGGGRRMCPDRHFPKAEVLSTFALLFTGSERRGQSQEHSARPEMGSNWSFTTYDQGAFQNEEEVNVAMPR